MSDPRVDAIRANELVGRGSCSSIDECYSDEELVAVLDRACITSPSAAVSWAVFNEGLHLEAGLNARWGEDNDPQLLMHQEWERRLNEAAEGV